mgnify:CR=1 FL=1
MVQGVMSSVEKEQRSLVAAHVKATWQIRCYDALGVLWSYVPSEYAIFVSQSRACCYSDASAM